MSNNQTNTTSALYNEIMEAGGKDSPSILAPGIYVQWKSRTRQYIDTKLNHDLIHNCIENGLYQYKRITRPAIDATNDAPAQREALVQETYTTVREDTKKMIDAKAEAVHIILIEIDNDTYSTVGYTNEGMSTLLEQLPMANILAEDQLFAFQELHEIHALPTTLIGKELGGSPVYNTKRKLGKYGFGQVYVSRSVTGGSDRTKADAVEFATTNIYVIAKAALNNVQIYDIVAITRAGKKAKADILSVHHDHVARISRVFLITFYPFICLKYTTDTFAVAMGTIIPAMTFLIAWVYRSEKVNIKKIHSIGKIVGTLVMMGGDYVEVVPYRAPYAQSSRVVGAVVIVARPYLVIWGKSKDVNEVDTKGEDDQFLPFFKFLTNLLLALNTSY
nr:WAT1-related protein At2g39510-like [Tanacetum cinerariifolium]